MIALAFSFNIYFSAVIASVITVDGLQICQESQRSPKALPCGSTAWLVEHKHMVPRKC